jgi:hypothetical protein
MEIESYILTVYDDNGNPIEIPALQGRGIENISRTSGNGSAGSRDVYTITYSDGTTSQFEIYNGQDGAPYVLTEADKNAIVDEIYGAIEANGSDVFWAEYEKTTYAEVQAAVDAGNVCLLNYMGTVYTMTFQNKSPLWFDFISVTSGVLVKLCRIKSDDSWSNSSSSALTSGQIDTFITQDSKDGHVPTSKAVYDAIQEFGVTDEKIVSAIITYMEDNPIEVPPVGRAVVVLAGTDFDNITVYSVVAPDQESDPVELLKAREADVLLILTKEDGLTAAPLVLSEFNPDDFTGEAYGDVVTEDGVYNVAVQFGFEGSWVSVTVNSAFTGGSGGSDVSRTEFDTLAETVDERMIPTYVLQEGEKPEDAPEWAVEVIDLFNDPESEPGGDVDLGEVNARLGAIEQNLGDIDTALDAILALQSRYIGGGTV